MESTGRYYQGGGKRNIRLHLVVGGACVPDYKEIVQKHGIQGRVIFHGWKSGDALNDIYNKADIAVDVLVGYLKDYRVYSQKEHAEVATTIREYAYKKCDMQFTLQPVINYILSRRENGGLNDGNISE